MDGEPCQHPGCRVCDYLPFHCPRCDGSYCLAHRSRFVHKCKSPLGVDERPVQDERVQLPSLVKGQEEKVRAVSAGPSASLPAVSHVTASSAPRTHLHLPTTTNLLARPSLTVRSAMSKLEQLEQHEISSAELQEHTQSQSQSQSQQRAKERRIARQTRLMLVKRHAHALETRLIPLPQRIFLELQVNVPLRSDVNVVMPSTDGILIFCDRHLTLRDFLLTVQSKYATVLQSLDRRQPSHQLQVALHTRDCEEWTEWLPRLSLVIDELFADGERVGLSVVPADLMTRELQLAATATATATAIATVAAAPEPISNSMSQTGESILFAKGDQAWYFKPAHGAESYISVDIIAVHRDDWPNVYYTIRMSTPVVCQGVHGEGLRFEFEKQTDPLHLLPLKAHVLPAHSLAAHASPAHRSLVDPLPSHSIFAHGTTSTATSTGLEGLFHEDFVNSNNASDQLALRFSHRGVTLRVVAMKVATVAQIKQWIASQRPGEVTLPGRSLKLLAAGRVLGPDTTTLQELKLAQECKIVVIG